MWLPYVREHVIFASAICVVVVDFCESITEFSAFGWWLHDIGLEFDNDQVELACSSVVKWKNRGWWYLNIVGFHLLFFLANLAHFLFLNFSSLSFVLYTSHVCLSGEWREWRSRTLFYNAWTCIEYYAFRFEKRSAEWNICGSTFFVFLCWYWDILKALTYEYMNMGCSQNLLGLLVCCSYFSVRFDISSTGLAFEMF